MNPTTAPNRARNTPAALAAVAQRQRRVRIGVVVITFGVVIFLIVIGLNTSQAATVSEALDVETARTERISDDYGDLATRVSTLCAAGGPDVALDQSQICALANAAIADPEVNTSTLTREEVTAIAQAAIAAQGGAGQQTGQGGSAAPDTAAIVATVLSAVRADSSLRGLDEATVRSIVEATLAARPASAPGRPGINGTPGVAGAPGSSFEGFERDGSGQCFAVVSMTGADGRTAVARQPAGDAACSPRPDPDPDPDPVDPDPDPDPVDPTPPPQSPEPDSPPPPVLDDSGRASGTGSFGDPEPQLPTPVPDLSAGPEPLFTD
ncbi:MAG: hypothetical protein H7Y15_05385 [Pseudonocardia sp.]|nr:hypothetical protein [Pseudonocardia sp.]